MSLVSCHVFIFMQFLNTTTAFLLKFAAVDSQMYKLIGLKHLGLLKLFFFILYGIVTVDWKRLISRNVRTSQSHFFYQSPPLVQFVYRTVLLNKLKQYLESTARKYIL